MAFRIKNPEADRLARELAAQTGETLTRAVIVALRERLERQQGRGHEARLREELLAIGERCSRLPVRDARSPDEVLGYDRHGLPT